MAQPTRETVNLATELIDHLAGSGLIPSFAKLYSHHTRIRENQPGLTNWRENEASNRLSDVVRLIEASLIHREIGDERWRNGMRRAGELLEWLSLPELNPDRLPIRLLAASAYQLAGYPARASGLLKEDTIEGIESRILISLLRADFVSLLEQLSQYWLRVHSVTEQGRESSSDSANDISDQLHELIVKETASCLGIICASMRWGSELRTQRAIEKLSAIGKVMLHGYDPYSWLLSKLCAEVASTYLESAMRNHLAGLTETLSETGRTVIERYSRQSYLSGRSLAWPSQIRGIERLLTNESFALCTPTGSGKTTVAELAILQNLFSEINADELSIAAPLVLYLVPSRALATEVEAKLSRVLRNTAPPAQQIIVTGLYGGTDWGPTDAWLTSNDPTVLICTYEKAEALMKFLGPLFLRRVSLVVIDEAHMVQFGGNRIALRKAESRELRLESLGARLFAYLDEERSRVIALSAVASEAENALAQWIARQPEGTPTKTNYRSTRQLIGHLECTSTRSYVIRYDLLDGTSLEFPEEEDGTAITPFVPNPFPPYPQAEAFEAEQTPGKKLRPFLFWAAMHLASPNDRGEQRAVLIAITQRIGGYAEDFLNLLNNIWADEDLPSFFQQPSNPQKLQILEQCLRSCEDYFGNNSREYQLLQKGVVVHHGKMPGLMARLLVDLIQERIINLVLATSTLSEGVNLPFETVLIPSLKRQRGTSPIPLTVREFSNLVGRAGRPGFGTEGRSLVLLPSQSIDRRVRQERQLYFNLIRMLQAQGDRSNLTSGANSALASLLIYLEEKWSEISRARRQRDFITWLEQTAPISFDDPTDDDNENPEIEAIEALDSLDSILLSAIVETEQIASQELSLDELEGQLQRIWRRTYAHYANQEEESLERVFIRRGRALKTNIYTDVSQRRRLYRTSLPPRSGTRLLELYRPLREHLETGTEYAAWSPDQRFNYIRDTVGILGRLSKFRVANPTRPRDLTWEQILRWWLCHRQAPRQPNAAQVTDWHDFVSQNFTYRFNWGLGSIIALAIDEAFGGELLEPSLEVWPLIGLPWIVFWMKELITWGTLDPVAAYLLARVDEVTTRQTAEEVAQQYYVHISDQDVNDPLDAAAIKNWAQASFSNLERTLSQIRLAPRTTRVSLLRDFSNASTQTFRVIPVEIGNDIHWFDPGGFPLARSQRPEDWQSDYLTKYDFTLNVSEQNVSPRAYV